MKTNDAHTQMRKHAQQNENKELLAANGCVHVCVYVRWSSSSNQRKKLVEMKQSSSMFTTAEGDNSMHARETDAKQSKRDFDANARL